MKEDSMQSWIIDFMERFGYLGIFLLITLENVFPPIPSEIILSFGGAMTAYTKLTITGVMVFATAGSVFGAVILYGAGRLLDVNRLERLITRWGHVLRVKAEDIHKADSWFKRYGYRAVFFCRMIPLIRSLISIPAGISQMRFGLFLLYTTAGTFIWNLLLVSGGALLGKSWGKIVKFMDIYSNITYTVLALSTIAFIFLWIYKKRRESF